MMSTRFWRETAERAAKTAAQAALLVLGADQLNALSADWAQVVGFAAGGAVLSVLTSIASSRVGDPTPSLVPQEEVD
jgi:hypothetical protein